MPDKEAFNAVCKDLEAGEALTLSHVGRAFGSDFWELIVYTMLDAQDAARAIQGAINRLSGRNDVEA